MLAGDPTVRLAPRSFFLCALASSLPTSTSLFPPHLDRPLLDLSLRLTGTSPLSPASLPTTNQPQLLHDNLTLPADLCTLSPAQLEAFKKLLLGRSVDVFAEEQSPLAAKEAATS